jgi:hypothetical protein
MEVKMLKNKKSMNLKSFILVLVLFCALEACFTTNDFYSPSDFIIPLDIGNTWYYKMQYFLGSEHVENIDVTWTINHTIEIDGTTIFQVDRSTEEFRLYANDNQGLLIYGSEMGNLPKPDLVVKFPAEIGDTWYDIYGAKIEVLSINSSVSVPAGVFNCYSIHRTHWFYESHEFWAPNIGLVKLITWDIDHFMKQIELVGYQFPNN